jgi:hypothetical protein
LKNVYDNSQFVAPAAKPIAEKVSSGFHSERSEESLPSERREKERFLVAGLLGMTRLRNFSASCNSALIFQCSTARLMVRLRSPQEPCPTNLGVLTHTRKPGSFPHSAHSSRCFFSDDQEDIGPELDGSGR